MSVEPFFPDPPDAGDFVILERGLSPTEAHVLCACLVSAGIDASTGDTETVQTHSLWQVALGGAKIRVPQGQLADARDVMAAFRRGEFALDDDFDPGATS